MPNCNECKYLNTCDLRKSDVPELCTDELLQHRFVSASEMGTMSKHAIAHYKNLRNALNLLCNSRNISEIKRLSKFLGNSLEILQNTVDHHKNIGGLSKYTESTKQFSVINLRALEILKPEIERVITQNSK